MKKLYNFFTHRVFLHVIFWTYNAIILLGAGLASIPLIYLLIDDAQSIPWNVALMAYILVLTPLAATILGLTRLRKEPKKLATLLFCVEIPLITLALARILFIRQLTPILWYLTLSGIVSAIGILLFLLKTKMGSKAKQILHTLSQEIALLVAGYGALLILFFLPIIIVLLYQLISGLNFGEMWQMFIATKGLALFYLLFFLLFFFMEVVFFFAAPIIATILYYKSFKESMGRLRDMATPLLARRLGIGFAVVYVVIGVGLSMQTRDTQFIKQLADIREAKTFAEKQALAKPLIQEKERIRQELRHAYLAQYRYLGDTTSNLISEGYTKHLRLDPSQAEKFQKFFNFVASPFIYRGTFDDDVKNASEQYEEMFDAHMQEGERAYIVDALKSTNTRDQLKAGLLDREEKRVRVVTREVKAMVSNNLMAKVSFEEEYENTSDQMQEVYYEFSLPEGSVVTGLWLGPDLEYPGVIAPKGAARRTYENQVRERVDPALLEQIGPRQYKLRVFPIPAKFADWLPKRPQDKNQRVKFEYVVSDLSAGIPLPAFGEMRNVFSDQKTKRSHILNGQPVAYTEGTLFGSPKTDCPTDILHIPVMMNQAYSDFNYILYLPHVVNPLIKESYNCTTRFGNVLPAQTKIAILLDVSGSNAGMDWQKYLKEHFPLKDLLGAQNTVDLYYFNDALSEKIPLTEEILQKGLTVIPFGKTNRLKALQSLPPEYDVTLMVTDDSSFDDIKKETSFRLQGQFPLYLIHPSGVFPAYRDDLTYQITMSGGGVFASPKEALRQLAIKKLLKDKQLELMANQTFSDSIIIGVDEQGTWFVSKRSATETNLFPALKLARLRPDDDIGKVAAGVFIRYLTFTSISVDEIHKIATDASIVSPYSSFIALVNDWQKSQLEQAKKQNDRFQADFDTGVAPLANPMGANALTIGAVPEPEEWLLMIVGVMLLLFFYRHRLLKFVR